MAQEKAESIHTSRDIEATSKAAEKPNLGKFYSRFESANDGLEFTSFHVLEQILKRMAQSGALDEVIYRNLERCTQFPTFIVLYSRGALTFPWFASHVKSFIWKAWKTSLKSLRASRIHDVLHSSYKKLRHYHLKHRMTSRTALMHVLHNQNRHHAGRFQKA